MERAFGTWNRAIDAAGLEPDTSNKKLSDVELESEFRRVVDILGKIPTRSEFFAESRHSPTVYERRFGSWGKVVANYLGLQASTRIQTGRRPRASSLSTRLPQSVVPRPVGIYSSKTGRPFGAPLDFRELRHEPVNEQGVVFLFGMIARELGFLVEAVGTGYPDCKAKRLHKGGHYIEVAIEFEFKSSNFREHGHDPAECDLIVCWEHDWPECPIEVIELKSVIRKVVIGCPNHLKSLS